MFILEITLSTRNKIKNEQMVRCLTKELLHNKRNYQNVWGVRIGRRWSKGTNFPLQYKLSKRDEMYDIVTIVNTAVDIQ